MPFSAVPSTWHPEWQALNAQYGPCQQAAWGGSDVMARSVYNPQPRVCNLHILPRRSPPRREMIDPPELMLATPTDRRFSDDDWLFERKLDGVRALSIRDGWRPQLWSRT